MLLKLQIRHNLTKNFYRIFYYSVLITNKYMLEYFNVVNHQYEANLRYFEAPYLYYLSKECMNFLPPLLDCSGVEVYSSIKWKYSS